MAAMAFPSENPKKNIGVTLDPELVKMLKEASELQAMQRHTKPKLSTFLNEFLHRFLPGELERLKQESKQG